jgi:hypothetical protein
MSGIEIFKFMVVLISSILLAGYMASVSEFESVFAKFGLFIVLSFCIFLVVSITAVLILYKPL